MIFTLLIQRRYNKQKRFSARGAGILGFSRFGKGRNFILDESMELNVDMLLDLCQESKRCLGLHLWFEALSTRDRKRN